MSNTPIFDELAEKYPSWIKGSIIRREKDIFKVMRRFTKALNLSLSKDKLS